MEDGACHLELQPARGRIANSRIRNCCSRAIDLRLQPIPRKIAKVEGEIAVAQGVAAPSPGLFAQEHPTRRSLRNRLAQLRENSVGIEKELSRR